MKIKTKDLIDEKQFLGHIILDCLNKEAIKMLETFKERDEETEFNVELKFEGISLDIREFTKHLEEEYEHSVKKECETQALVMFDKFKQDYKSKNSNNSKLSKIKDQLDKVNNQLVNLNNSFNYLEVK